MTNTEFKEMIENKLIDLNAESEQLSRNIQDMGNRINMLDARRTAVNGAIIEFTKLAKEIESRINSESESVEVSNDTENKPEQMPGTDER